ncbi:MAG: hypothetical protein CMO44_13080 [Verrucomicrobiales bacterium]|mgnify:CR=1 FL=1|nr:hypothetical protein [Verrucomicrobiales bacterium]|tara:strand:- start:30894 stop:31655 length:762 start_codon:yes stop_codon:yes gene_type:complete
MCDDIQIGSRAFKALEEDEQEELVFEACMTDSNSNDSFELHEYVTQFFLPNTETPKPATPPTPPPPPPPPPQPPSHAPPALKPSNTASQRKGSGWGQESRDKYQKTWNERKEIRTRVDTSIRMLLDTHIYRKLLVSADDFNNDLRNIEFDHKLLRQELMIVFREIPGIDSFKEYQFTTIDKLVEDVSLKCIGRIGYQRKTKRPYKKSGRYVGMNGAKPRRKRNEDGDLVENTNVPERKPKRSRGRPRKNINML